MKNNHLTPPQRIMLNRLATQPALLYVSHKNQVARSLAKYGLVKLLNFANDTNLLVEITPAGRELHSLVLGPIKHRDDIIDNMNRGRITRWGRKPTIRKERN